MRDSKGRTRSLEPRIAADLGAGLLLTVAVVALAYAYVAHERYFYSWDWAGFHCIAANFVEQLRADPGTGIGLFRDSMKAEYNLVFAVPLIPVLAATNGARTAYVAAVAGLYLVPFAMLTGVVCRRAFPKLGRVAFWTGTVLAVVTPPVWLSVMRGYPDVMAAGAVMAALAVLLGDVRLERWRTVMAIGFLLALAVTVRRHMAYAAMATVCTAELVVLRHGIAVLGRGTDAAMRELRSRLLRMVALPIAAAGFLALLDPGFIANLVHNDYRRLYASYQRPALELLSLFRVEALGPVWFAIGALGIFLGLARERLRATPDTALTLYGALWLTWWLVGPRQDGPHQLIVALPLIVVAGVLRVADCAHENGWSRAAGAWLAAVFAYAFFNAGIADGPDQNLYSAVQERTALLSTYSGPLRRNDFEEIRTLLAGLREGPQPVLIAASSEIFNFDLVAKAEARLFGRDVRLSVLVSPQIDSRDPLPVEDLLRAGQVVVVTPFQYHLAQVSQQRVVHVLVDAFVDDWPVARDFRRQEREFHLERGMVASVYQRVRPSSLATAIETYERVVAVTGEAPPQFRDTWLMSASEPAPGVLNVDGGGQSFYYPPSALDGGPVTLTMLRPLHGPLRVEGAVNSAGACAGIRLEAMDALKGVVLGALDVPGNRPISFAFHLDERFKSLLSLVARRLGEGSCYFNAENVRLTADR